MAYIFDPIRNTFVDDEDTSLGNKLALNDEEFEELLKIPGVFRASQAPKPPKTIEREMFQNAFKDNKANGGRLKAGFPLLAPAVATQIGTLLGLTGTGLVLQRKIQDAYENNPEFFDNILKSIGYTGEGQVFAPDDKDRKEAEPIILSTPDKPVGITDYRESFGDDELAKALLKTEPETFPAEPEKLPITSGETKPIVQGPTIFENRKKETDDLKKDFDDKAWRDTTVITGAGETRKSVGQKTNVPFFEKLNNYTKEYHGGNLKSAIKEIGNIKTKKGERNLTLENLYTQINAAAKRSDFKFDAVGKQLFSDIPVSKVPLDFKDFTNQLRTDTSVLDNRVKELKLDKDTVLNKKQLLDALGLDKSDKRRNNFVIEVLKDQGVNIQNLPGGVQGVKFSDAITALKDYSKNKLTNYESRKYSSSLKKKSTESYLLRAKVDGKNFTALNSQINKAMNKTLGRNDLYLPDSVAQLGHNPVPVEFYKKYKMFKDKKLSDKIFNIQNYTWQGKEINYEALAQKSGKLENGIKILNKYYGKKVTDKNIKEITEGANLVKEFFSSADIKAEKISKELPFPKDVIPKLEISIPKVGSKLSADNFIVDKSDVDPKHVIGNVDLINPNAAKYDDLSAEEKLIYGQNIIDQKIEQLKEFYGPNGADFPPEIIEDLIEQFEFGEANVKGAFERKGLGRASGGGVEITPLPRIDFGNGGATGMSSDEFVKELEYYFTNPDADLPKATTFRETMNPIEILNDMIDPRNYPYIADRLVKSGIRIGEFGLRVLPAVGKLIGDVTTKPSFKIQGKTGTGYIQDYDQMPKSAKIKGTGIFSEFLDNLVGTEMTEGISRATGLDDLIKMEEQKMMDRRTTAGPKILADTLTLGMEFTAPIFPGLRLLKSFAKARNLPVDNTTKELLEKEIDNVLDKNGISRRDFMKTVGAGSSLVIAKMLGFGDEFTKASKVVRPTIDQTTTGGVPPYFFELVKKIKKSGRTIEPEYDPRVENNMVFENYIMRENKATGEISIQKTKEGMVDTGSDYLDGTISEETITYKPGEDVIGTDGKTYRTPDEYEEFTTKPDINDMGKMKDVEPGLDSIEEIIELMPNQLKMSDLEKAGYNVEAFPDNIKQLLIDDLQKID